MRSILRTAGAVALALTCACSTQQQQQRPAMSTTERPAKLNAKLIDSGFADAHDTYNAISCASDGRIYYVLSAERADLAAKMFVYDPKTNTTKLVGDLNEAAGEAGAKSIAQGKSHVSFVESSGKLYFATHIGFYSIIDGMETPGIPPAGMKPYPGGHFLAYEVATGKFESLAIAPRNEGIITFQMDPARGRMYGLTWPTGVLIRYDLGKKEFKEIGPVSGGGEAGKGNAFRTICRSMQVDPADGSLYFSTSDGIIHRYDYTTEKVADITTDDLKKDYFGLYDPSSAGHMGYNWRQTFWHGPTKSIYGVHGNSGYLFRFTPSNGTVEVLDRITSKDSKRTGMFDQFSYGYLGFALGPDNKTIYYLTGGPVFDAQGRRVRGKDSTAKGESKGRENLHLITWDIDASKYTDHGPIFFDNGQRPNYVNSIAVGKDGSVYALTRISEDDHARTDLMRIAPVNLR